MAGDVRVIGGSGVEGDAPAAHRSLDLTFLKA